jgi:hypothetical protein
MICNGRLMARHQPCVACKVMIILLSDVRICSCKINRVHGDSATQKNTSRWVNIRMAEYIRAVLVSAEKGLTVNAKQLGLSWCFRPHVPLCH